MRKTVPSGWGSGVVTVFTGQSAYSSDRVFAVVLAVVVVAGCGLGWNRGQLPRRGEPIAAQATGDAVECEAETIAADLALYRDVIADVRAGQGYYDAAARRIPQYGFPTSSPLNWRLPTYAWLFSWLPGPRWVQAALVVLSIVALALAFSAQARTIGPVAALFTTVFLFGVVRWAIDGYAYLAQEPWAATLLVISLAAHALAQSHRGRGTEWWTVVSVTVGVAALLFRELAFPYCVLACLFAASKRRWPEAAGWAAGISLFLLLMAWHVWQVKLHTPGTTQSTGDLGQWLRFGGLDFVLLTTRMNSLLFAAPGWLLWLYLLLALVGLADNRDETSQLACLGALGYLLVFAVLGRPENFYWGLMPAPLLAWGASSGPGAIARLWRGAASAPLLADLPASAPIGD
jgi:hypothetical protein